MVVNGCKSNLVADSGRDTTQQRRHLRARLGEAEDVVDEQQHILSLLVTEILGDGQTGQADAGAGSRGLVHLNRGNTRQTAERDKRRSGREREQRTDGRRVRHEGGANAGSGFMLTCPYTRAAFDSPVKLITFDWIIS